MGERRRDVFQGPGAVAVATGAVYAVLAGLMWEIDPTWGSAFWPAAGVTFAVLVRTPARWWAATLAAVALAEAGVNLIHDTSVATALWGAGANTVEPLLGAALFVRMTGRRRLVDLRSLGWFVVAGAMVGPAVGAVFGGLLVSEGPAPAIERWVRWLVGDGVGVIAVAPVLLASTVGELRRRSAEAAGLVLATVVLGIELIGPDGTLGAVGPYLAVPVLLWGALRFGVLGAALTSTVVAVTVHAATATGNGQFALEGRSGLVVAQTYIGVIAVSALTVALLVQDIAARRRVEQDLLHRALHDPLTGLPNRAFLDTRLATGDVGAVLAVDLDGFKAVNDDLGHLVGDEVLKEVARRLRVESRPEDFVARVGGDEFVVVLDGLVMDDALTTTADRIETVLAAPMHVAGTEVTIGASVGAVPAGVVDDTIALLMEADRRMYVGKRERRRRAQRSERTPT